MTEGGGCMSSWLTAASLYVLVTLSFVLQPALSGPVLQQQRAADATASSADPYVREDNFESRFRRGMTSLKDYAWPDAIVPFLISDQFSEEESETVLSAMEMWMIDTCLQFVPHTNESQYVHFVRSSSCSSPIGKQPQSGPQTVKINPYCLDNVGSIAHEIGHALGFWNEHQRPDRDEFVEVLYDNIPLPYHHLFYKLSDKEIDSLHVDYDYGSIMHLSLFAYSSDKTTPSLRLLKNYSREVGQRRNTSELDRKQVRLFYACQDVPLELTHIPTTTLPRMSSTSLKPPASPFLSPSLQNHTSSSPFLSVFHYLSSSQLITSIAPSISQFLPSPNLTSKPTTIMGHSTLQYLSSSSQSATTTTLSDLPSPSSVSQPNIEKSNVIGAGVKFGMRIITEPAQGNLWVECKGEKGKTCKLSHCPSKHGLHHHKCLGSTYIFEKINGSSDASVIVDKDCVVLRPSIDTSSIVHCGDKSKNKANTVCKYFDKGCGTMGEFETESCSYHIIEIHLHGNEGSSGSSHPQVTFHFLDEENISWLGCNLHDKMKCRRFSCEDTQSCSPDKFELVEVSV